MREVDPSVVLAIELLRSQLAQVQYDLTERIIKRVRREVDADIARTNSLPSLGDKFKTWAEFTATYTGRVGSPARMSFAVEELAYLESLVTSLEVVLAKFTEQQLTEG